MTSDFQKIWDDLRSLGFSNVREGKRDTMADLRRLGIEGDIVVNLTMANRFYLQLERISQNIDPLNLCLMDWDKAGNELAKQLISYGEACDLIPVDKNSSITFQIYS